MESDTIVAMVNEGNFDYSLDGGITWASNIKWSDLPSDIKTLWRETCQDWPNADKVWAWKHKETSSNGAIVQLTKTLYWFLNLFPRRCHKLGYCCEYVYPYGFVPEGGCPIHD